MARHSDEIASELSITRLLTQRSLLRPPSSKKSQCAPSAMIRSIAATLAFTALSLVPLAVLQAVEAAKTPPGRISSLIFADDLGINDLGCYGRKDHRTPNLDRLASQGMRFTCAYTAQPICSPSRAAIMTGKCPARLNLTNYLPGRPDAPSQRLLQPRIEGQLPLEEETIAELLTACRLCHRVVRQVASRRTRLRTQGARI